jgi:hypothetical protein
MVKKGRKFDFLSIQLLNCDEKWMQMINSILIELMLILVEGICELETIILLQFEDRVPLNEDNACTHDIIKCSLNHARWSPITQLPNSSSPKVVCDHMAQVVMICALLK